MHKKTDTAQKHSSNYSMSSLSGILRVSPVLPSSSFHHQLLCWRACTCPYVYALIINWPINWKERWWCKKGLRNPNRRSSSKVTLWGSKNTRGSPLSLNPIDGILILTSWDVATRNVTRSVFIGNRFLSRDNLLINIISSPIRGLARENAITDRLDDNNWCFCDKTWDDMRRDSGGAGGPERHCASLYRITRQMS